jgi:tetratricopeptide (TPR) repeat protein
MRNNWFTYLLSIAFSVFLTHGKSNELFEKANNAYQNENFEEAYMLYDSLFKKGLSSTELHYNTANALFRLDRLGAAILHYEKALKLDPAFEDASFNLKVARSRLSFKQPTEILNRSFAATLLTRTPDYWAWAAVFMFVIMAVFYVLFLLSTNLRMRKLNLNTGIAALGFGIVCMAFAFWQNKETASSLAVVTEREVEVYSEPNENAKTLFLLEKGATVKITETRDSFLEIQFDTEKKGWVKTEEIQPV